MKTIAVRTAFDRFSQQTIFLSTLLLWAALFGTMRSKAQTIMNFHDNRGYLCEYNVVELDTVPIVDLSEVQVWGTPLSANSREVAQWNRLVRNVKVAYPYARIAGEKFNDYNAKLENVTSERDRKAMMSQAEDELQAQFGNELKKLTTSQGKVLIKLIDRQTENTSYDIVKEFRGRFRAFFYQSFARLFGMNLKSEYDALGGDADIERIVLMIEHGTI